MPEGAGDLPLTPDSDGVPDEGNLWQMEMRLEGSPGEGEEYVLGSDECGFAEGAADAPG